MPPEGKIDLEDGAVDVELRNRRDSSVLFPPDRFELWNIGRTFHISAQATSDNLVWHPAAAAAVRSSSILRYISAQQQQQSLVATPAAVAGSSSSSSNNPRTFITAVIRDAEKTTKKRGCSPWISFLFRERVLHGNL